MKIVLIGAGNVATHLGQAFKQKGIEILQVYSRTRASAQALGELLDVSHCCSLEELNADADIYIYSLTDSALEEIIPKINIPKAVHVHTAGSVPMNIFENNASRFGVIYPLQTFSKNKAINIGEVPFFIEASDWQTEDMLHRLVQTVSTRCHYLDSEKRLLVHLSAVFACNFSNYMYVLASEIISETGLEFNTLLPLIKEAADKLNYLTPAQAQTGPAARKDEITIKKHEKTVANRHNLLQIYSLLTESIEKSTKTN